MAYLQVQLLRPVFLYSYVQKEEKRKYDLTLNNVRLFTFQNAFVFSPLALAQFPVSFAELASRCSMNLSRTRESRREDSY